MLGLVVGALAQAAVTLTSVAQGSASGITERREVVVRSAREWQSLWEAHSSQSVPKIDFSQTMVVGVFLGSRPTAGYQVDIVATRPDSGSLIVEYRERQPEPDALVAQVLTSPFHLVRLPRQSGRVDFRRLDTSVPRR